MSVRKLVKHPTKGFEWVEIPIAADDQPQRSKQIGQINSINSKIQLLPSVHKKLSEKPINVKELNPEIFQASFEPVQRPKSSIILLPAIHKNMANKNESNEDKELEYQPKQEFQDVVKRKVIPNAIKKDAKRRRKNLEAVAAKPEISECVQPKSEDATAALKSHMVEMNVLNESGWNKPKKPKEIINQEAIYRLCKQTNYKVSVIQNLLEGLNLSTGVKESPFKIPLKTPVDVERVCKYLEKQEDYDNLMRFCVGKLFKFEGENRDKKAMKLLFEDELHTHYGWSGIQNKLCNRLPAKDLLIFNEFLNSK